MIGESPTPKTQIPSPEEARRRFRCLGAASIFVALTVSILFAQGRPPQTGTAVIRGRILAGDTGRPLRRAQITLTGGGAPPRNVSTNVQGRYEIKDLPAGRYTLSVRRSGYLSLQYGQRRPGEQARPLQIGAEQIVDNTDFTLPRAGSIAVRVLDDAGEPMAGAIVWAMRPIFVEGRRQLAIADGGFETTDDTGEFRLTGLTPGTYYLRAWTRETWTVVVDGRRQLMGFAPTFHPGVPSANDARGVEVGVGQQVRAPDLMMITTRPARISGIALSSAGQPLNARLVGLQIRFLGAAGGGRGGGGMNVATAPLAPDGTFTLRDVPAGEYELTASSGNVRNGEGETARAIVVVDGTDIDDVRLVATAGWSASGRFVTEEGTAPPFPPAQANVQSNLLDDVRAGNAAVGTVRPDWTFTLTPILGRTRLQAGVPQGWMVKTIRRDGRDITELPLELRSGERLEDIEIVVTDRVTTVTGLLADDRGAPRADGTVVVFAADAARWGVGSRFVAAVRADQKGQWQVRGLPAGEYLAAALEYVEENIWNDPAFLESLRQQAQRFVLADGETQSVSLRVGSP